MTKQVKIWIWLQNEKPMKAMFYPLQGILLLYDEHDCLLLKRTGLTPDQIKSIELSLAAIGAKRIDNQKEPFTYL